MFNNHWRSRNKRTLTMQELAGGFNSGRLRTVLLRNSLERKKYQVLSSQIERDKEMVRKKLQNEVQAYRKIYSDLIKQKQQNYATSLAQEDPAPLNKRTVLYQEQVVRTRSSILNVFLGRRGGGGGENPHKKTIRPRHNKPSSTNVELSNSSTIDL